MGTIHVTADLNTIGDTFNAIDFEIVTPAELSIRYAKKHGAPVGKIWKMTRSASQTPSTELNHYNSLKSNNVIDGDKLLVIAV